MPSVLLKGRYKNLDVRKAIQYSNESHFSHQRSLATELTALYLENKTAALMGSVSNPRLFHGVYEAGQHFVEASLVGLYHLGG